MVNVAKRLIQPNIQAIINYCEQNPKELDLLLTKDYSKEKFNLNYPFFVDSTENVDNERYWKKVYLILGNSLRITNDWYARNVNQFIKYIESIGIIPEVDNTEKTNSNNSAKKNTENSEISEFNNWPAWKLPAEEEIYQLAQITTKYIRFLNPEIIKAITENNIEHCEEWRNLLSINNINPDLYLWHLSPCSFPGVRRYAGKERRNFRKQKNKISNALKLDDNDFPKEIWSFIFTGKEFRKIGPNDYSLAHLFDHKEYKNRMKEELEFHNEDNNPEPPYFGLYTCPTNTVFIPNSLIKPTDFNLTLRRLLFQKAESLYKDYCNVLPPFIKIPKPENEKWNIEKFQWGECVGTLENVNAFLDYRNDIMKEMLGY